MKINYKYILLLFIFTGLVACDKEELVAPDAPLVEYPALDVKGLDFSKYVSIGASFTAGFSDGALFKISQQRSFPAILAEQFAKAGGGDFTQPLMSDNIGGVVAGGNAIQPPRLYFNGKAPVRLDAMPTTTLANLGGTFNNMGVPGAKSFHMGASGYGNVQGVAQGLANPYFARFSSSATASMLGDALAQAPTFFTLSEVGGNDVLVYATSGGSGKDQKNNLDARTYGPADITDPRVFASVYNQMVTALTAGGRKGVIATVPNITSLPHFTTVPHNPVPLDAATAGALNSMQAYGAYNAGVAQALAGLVQMGEITQAMADADMAKRKITFAAGEGNAVVIADENLIDLTSLNPRLVSIRQATAEDLLVLPASSFIGTLADPDNPQSVNGVGVPLADKWVLTPQEQTAIADAVEAYNTTIKAIAASNENVALVDLNAILTEASTSGIKFGNYTMSTKLVTGGLVSLDGVHLTSRGYALMAYKFLEAIDAKFGSNFIAANAVPNAGSYPTNYPSSLK